MRGDPVLGIRWSRARGSSPSATGNRVRSSALVGVRARVGAAPWAEWGPRRRSSSCAVVARPGRARAQPGRGRRADDDLARRPAAFSARAVSVARRARARAARGWARRRGTGRRRPSARRPTSTARAGPTDVGTEPPRAGRRASPPLRRRPVRRGRRRGRGRAGRRRRTSAARRRGPPRCRSIGPNTRLSVSTISSAPIRPRRDSRSVRAVKPETSANTSVPSTTRQSAPGASSSHTRVLGGTWRRRSVIGRAHLFADPGAASALAVGRLRTRSVCRDRGSAVVGRARRPRARRSSSVCVARSARPVASSSATAGTPRASPSRPRPASRRRCCSTPAPASAARRAMLGGAPVSRHHPRQPPALGPRAGAAVLRGRRPRRRHGAPASCRRRVAESGRDLVAQMMSPPAFPITPGGPHRRLDVRRRAARATSRSRASRCAPSRWPTRVAAPSATRCAPGGGSIGYVPDHAPELGVSDDALDALAGVDVLIHDAQFLEHERPRAVDYGHATVDDAIRARRAGRCRRGRALPPRSAPHRRRARRHRATSSRPRCRSSSRPRGWSSTCA